MKSKHFTLTERAAYRGLEDVVGCKWSAAVVGALQRGITRPGQLERYIPGISTKILNERLRKTPRLRVGHARGPLSHLVAC
jgi:DNA-binding HxlR family transcriptional regulator